MHIPQSLNPNIDHVGDSVEHFAEGISNMIEMISQLTQQWPDFTPEQQPRAGLAAIDAGTDKIRAKSKLTSKILSK